MVLTDIELSNLKKQLSILKNNYQILGEDKHLDDINFLNDIITKIDKDLTNINKVIFNKIGQNGIINKIYAGGHICYYYDKYHNVISDISLKNHIGEEFECHIHDLANDTTEVETKILSCVSTDNDGNITDVKFK